jgi:predicted RNase H-like nuclease (RuvC/YqgF family)
MSGQYKFTILALDPGFQTALGLIAKYGATTYTFLALGATAVAAFLVPRAMREKKAAIAAELEGLEEKRTDKFRELLQEYRADAEVQREKMQEQRARIKELEESGIQMECKLDKIEAMADELEHENELLKDENAKLKSANAALESRVSELTQVPHE